MERIVWLFATPSGGTHPSTLARRHARRLRAVKRLFRKTGARFEATRLLLRVAMPTFQPQRNLGDTKCED
jgi:hypothetical protein